jgi:hypothetical protein
VDSYSDNDNDNDTFIQVMVTKDITNTSDRNDNNGGGTNTGLIAGLTTGLVVAAVVALTAGLLIYRKRKRAQMGVERKAPVSVETPPSSSNLVLTAPTISPPPSNITVPMASHLDEEVLIKQDNEKGIRGKKRCLKWIFQSRLGILDLHSLFHPC